MHCPASAENELGCLHIFLLCYIQVYPSVELPVDRVCSGLGWGWVTCMEEGHIFTPHDSTQSWPEQRSTAHQLPLSSTYEYSCVFCRVGWTCWHQPLLLGTIQYQKMGKHGSQTDSVKMSTSGVVYARKSNSGVYSNIAKSDQRMHPSSSYAANSQFLLWDLQCACRKKAKLIFFCFVSLTILSM